MRRDKHTAAATTLTEPERVLRPGAIRDGDTRDLEIEARSLLAPMFLVESVVRRGRGRIDFVACEVSGRRRVLLSVRHRSAEPGSEDKLTQALGALQTLRHPSIVPLMAFDVTARLVWFATRAAVGTSLDDWLRTEGPLEVEFAIRAVRQLAAALQYAHEHGIAHGHVNPGNIIVDEDGRAAITGFAIAQLGGPGARHRDERFTAPECAFTSRRLPAADQYSLAATLCECLAPSPADPLKANARSAKLRPCDPAAVRPDVPAHVMRALERATRLHPRDRFPSLQAFAAALTASAVSEPRSPYTNPPPVLFVEPERSRSERRRKVSIALLGAGVAVWALGWLMPSRDAGTVVPGTAPATAMAELKPIAPLQPRVSENGSRTGVAGAPGLRRQSTTQARTSGTTAPPAARVAPRTGPTKPAAVTSAVQGRRSGRGPVDAPGGQDTRAGASDSATQPAKLFVSSRPWGQLFVDGQLVGNTPRADLPLSPGLHRLRIVRDGFQPFERDVQVLPGQTIRLIDLILEEIRR